MLYCEQCRTLSETPCGKPGHRPRSAHDNDPVLVGKSSQLQAGMMEEILQKEGIPVLRQGLMGAGLSTWAGGMLEQISLYVPFAAYEKAKELLLPFEEDVPAEILGRETDA